MLWIIRHRCKPIFVAADSSIAASRAMMNVGSIDHLSKSEAVVYLTAISLRVGRPEILDVLHRES